MKKPLPRYTLSNVSNAPTGKQHYNLYHIFREDRQNKRMNPQRSAQILALLLSKLAQEESPWKKNN